MGVDKQFPALRDNSGRYAILLWRLDDGSVSTHSRHLNVQGRLFTLQWRHNERLNSPASRLFAQSFVQAQIKEKHWSSASLAFLTGIHQRPVNSPHKGPVTRKCLMTSSWYIIPSSCDPFVCGLIHKQHGSMYVNLTRWPKNASKYLCVSVCFRYPHWSATDLISREDRDSVKWIIQRTSTRDYTIYSRDCV